MSRVAQLTAIMIFGGGVGAATVAFLGNQPEPAAAQPAPAVESAPVALKPPSAPAAAPDAVLVEYATTGAIEQGLMSTAFAVFHVTASEDVGDVELQVTGGRNASALDAPGFPTLHEGATLAITIGTMDAGELRRVVVPFAVEGSSGEFGTQTSYRDLETGRAQSLEPTRGHSISLSLRDADAYETVRKTYTSQAIEGAQAHIDAGEYQEALDWVRDARAANIEVGQVLRISGELGSSTRRLQALEDEIRDLMQPKPRSRKPRVEEPGIDVIRGDAPNRRTLERI